MPFVIDEYTDAQLFRDAVIDRLLESEAENCAHIGMIERLADQTNSKTTPDGFDRPLLLSVSEARRVEAVAIQTRKKFLLVSRGSTEAMFSLSDTLAERKWGAGDMVGASPSIEALVTRYAELTGRTRRRVVRLRTFQLSTVSWPTVVSGSMRICTESDRHLLAEFIEAFSKEIGEPSAEGESLAVADRRIRDRQMFFWVDKNPVAMAGWAGRTPNGVRINSVYTPPRFRGRGYASNLVAQLTQSQIDGGRKLCFLLTDLSNPTSNRIYQNLGYQAVGDSERWELGGAIA